MTSLAETAQALWRMLPLAPGLVRPYCFRGRPFVSAWAETPDQLARGLAAGEEMGRDVYVQLNAARRVGWRPRSEDVPAIQAILVDLDPIGDGTLYRDAVTMFGRLVALGVKRDQIATIYSGRGYQLWVLTRDAPREAAARIPALLRLLDEPGLDTARVDLGCTDLPRLARAPGTTNTKSGRAARIVSEARPGPWDWLLQFPEYIPQKYDGPTFEHQSWFRYLPHLSSTARRFLLEGASMGERHRAAFATAAALLDAGALPQVAWEALCYSAELMSFLHETTGTAESLPVYDLEHILNTAIRRRKCG